MNVIYIHTHDTGRFIEPYGENVSTPNLMRFAKEATVFRQAFCTGPTCSPSRAGLLTGMMPHNNGMLGLAHMKFQLNNYQFHLANHLKSKGFHTVLAGVQHVAKEDEMIGYERIISSRDHVENPEESDLLNADKVCDFLKEEKEGPFFLSFGMFSTHRPFPHKLSVNPDYVKPPFTQADTPENRLDMAQYITSADYMDMCFGKVYEALKESGHIHDSLIIFTTDHGIAFPMMKCNLNDSGIGVSLIMDYPNNPSKTTVKDSLVSHLDVFPTICDLLGIEIPSRLQGKSLRPIFENRSIEVRTEIFAEVNYHVSYEPIRCIRTKRYKLIKYYDTHESVVPANIDDSYSKSTLLGVDYMNAKIERTQLYDLFLDPTERHNVINDINYKKVYETLRIRLLEWQQETNDPILRGPIPKPSGSKIRSRAAISPKVQVFEPDNIR